MTAYVALLDILGFKDIIEKNTHEEALHYFETFRNHLQGGIANWKATEGKYGETVFDVKTTDISSLIISDTIIFWTRDDSIKSFFDIVRVTQELLRFNHNLPKRYLRGGITHGDFYYNNNGIITSHSGATLKHDLMFGKALVHADAYEKNLEMIGCIIDDGAIQHARSKKIDVFDKSWEQLKYENKILLYPCVPFKKETRECWTLNWIQDASYPELSEIIDGFSADKKSIDHPTVQQKIENTVAYFQFAKRLLDKRKSND